MRYAFCADERMSQTKTIYTIGHSTHSIEEFIRMLHAFGIELLADIRSFPGSRRLPHFNKENLEAALQQNGIKYIHLPELGGRRRAAPDSKNTVWKVAGFRGYADYMETNAFKDAADKLAKLAMNHKTAYMCAEAVWWSCHRSLLSDWYKAEGWTVLHILSTTKAEEHPYTKPAHIVDGKLSYEGGQMELGLTES